MKKNLLEFYNFSNNLGLNIIGIMCIPPFDEDPTKYFSQMRDLNQEIDLNELDDICDECKEKDESVSQNLILTGFKICKSCRVSKTIFPI